MPKHVTALQLGSFARAAVVRDAPEVQGKGMYRTRRGVSHPRGAVFQARFQYRTTRLRKALGETFPTPILFGTDTIPTMEISTMENRPRGV